ncbi:MAG: hypothetical protein Q8927_18805 [Bacteroidota bacterium]|nr:hypothetical protein [Bacteroidota bacterium]MDP4218256.1 hypothetical protein [Bacteroidota bacterium]MDP4245789.1 hypothetical protein [Bacteroidota bacterium]MDP4253539.1 hypothetical protein [Bacteroidota bacterium]MDP4257065.1 hypothetical protein [Bacteroidota bacterium]
MFMRVATYGVVLLLLISKEGLTQDMLTGKVLKKGTSELLLSVSVQNQTRKKYTLTDAGGAFRIPAGEGDSILFTSAGYRPDTLVVRSYMFFEGFEVTMQPNVVALTAVRVGSSSNYQQDSIDRWKDYEWLKPRQNTRLLDNLDKVRTGDGVGISITPRIYSSGEKDRMRLRRRLDDEEEQHYVDFRFSREYVGKLTRFEGDTLTRFMTLYRPTYAFCRSAGSVDMLLYVNDSMIKFKQIKSE